MLKAKASNFTELDILASRKAKSYAASIAYAKIMRMFAGFMDVFFDEATSMVPKSTLTDSNIMKFFHALGEEKGRKPHTKKEALSAINDQLAKHGLSNICKFPQDWPQTYIVLGVSI